MTTTPTADESTAPFHAALPPGVDVLGPFVASGLLDPVDVHLAASIARLSGDLRPGVVLGAAFASRAPRLGHVCLDVTEAARTIVGDLAVATPLPWPAPAAWAAELATSPAVAPAAARHEGDADPRPLVLDGERLYLERTWRDEQTVAARLLALATRPTLPLVVPDEGRPSISGDDGSDRSGGLDVAVALDRWFPSAGPDAGPAADRQREAAASMLTRALTVIAGGPGTGKTRTLARVLALVRTSSESPHVRIALAAPTGKAAARMGEAVAAQLTDAGLDDATREAILTDARPVTLHRLLGLGPSRRRPRTLDADLVIVDEASMISLSLMAELVRALPAHGRLVLVGDPHQLTSVEAGTVLADIVQAATTGGPLADAVVTLERPFRFGADSAIARLAAAVRTGDLSTAREVLADDAGRLPADRTPGDAHGDSAAAHDQRTDRHEAGLGADGLDAVRLIGGADPLGEPGGAGVADLVVPAARRTFAAAVAGDAAGALAALRSTRLLCAHRTGRHGIDAWNRQIEDWLRDREPRFDPRTRWHVGRPLLITRNDPITGLANGDVGVVVRAADPATGGASTDLASAHDLASRGVATGSVAVAVERQGAVALLRPVQLPDVETYHAMTIHKSQGSEFDRVVVVLPPAESPLATRELLYTAITRGRREVLLVGTDAALAAAVSRVVSRASGLVELLAGAPPQQPAGR